MDWSQKYNYNYPTSVRFGKGVIEELGSHLKEQGLKKVLLVTDPGLAQLPIFKKVLSLLEKESLQVISFFDIHKNPVKSDVVKGVKVFKENKADCVVGMGGGASMDVARAIVLWVNHEKHDLFDFDDLKDGWKYVIEDVPYFVTVPTTSGTGSEVGRSTVISDDITHAKKILFSAKLMPKKVFADPELTMGLPAFVTAATGLDGLTHNLEAYLAKGVHPMADGIALEAISLIFESLERCTQNPDLESRGKMQMAALMGATAFQKGLGVVHSLAHPLSTVFDMHHGLANAIMLTYGLEFNLSVPVVQNKIKRLMAYCRIPGDSASDFVSYLKAFTLKVGMPLSLQGQVKSFSEAEQTRLVELAMEDPCYLSNPKTVTKADFKALYQKAYHA